MKDEIKMLNTEFKTVNNADLAMVAGGDIKEAKDTIKGWFTS